jgi:antitoxin StbD
MYRKTYQFMCDSVYKTRLSDGTVIVMTTRGFQQVVATSEARVGLSQTLERFRRDGASAEPTVFGGHRRPEGVILPFEMYERILSLLEDIAIAESVRKRLANPAESLPIEQLLGDLGFSASEFD